MKKEDNIKQKQGGSGVGDTIEMNLGCMNKNLIQTQGSVVR